MPVSLLTVNNPTVSQALADASDIVTSIIQMIGGQPILLAALGMGVIVPAGTRAVRKLVKSVR